MSLQTTLARVAARDAERCWKAHKAHCHHCAPSRVRREDMCDQGIRIHGEYRDAQADLARNRDLDRRPTLGQGTLL